MENNSAAYSEKKFRMSPLAIACYAIACLTVIYMFYLAGSTVSQINEYYAQYGMSAKASDYVKYIAQSLVSPAITGFTFFMLGYILDTVRKLDPNEAKMAKQEAKDAKAFAKGEKAAAKAEKAAAKVDAEKSKEDSVAEDFANSLDKELKAATKTTPKRNTQRKPAAKKTGAKTGTKTGTGTGTQRKSQSKSGNASANRNSQRKTSSAKKQATKKDAAEAFKPQNEAPKADEGFKVEINE